MAQQRILVHKWKQGGSWPEVGVGGGEGVGGGILHQYLGIGEPLWFWNPESV